MGLYYNNKSTSLDLREERSQDIRKTRPSCPWLKKKISPSFSSHTSTLSKPPQPKVPHPSASSTVTYVRPTTLASESEVTPQMSSMSKNHPPNSKTAVTTTVAHNSPSLIEQNSASHQEECTALS